MNRTRKDVVMLAFMAALVLIAAFNFGIRPQRSAASDVAADLDRVEQDISAAQIVLQAPTTTVAGDAASDPVPAVPADPAVSDLLREVHAVADTAGVTLTAIAPTPLGPNPNGPGGSVQVAITASGSHGGAQALVAGLRDMDRLVVVEQIADDGQAAGAAPADQTDLLQLSVRVFTRQQPAATPTAASVAPASAPNQP